MTRRAPSALDLDILRATLGPSAVAPFAHAAIAGGGVPWLTAGTLTWPVSDAFDVAEAWVAWAAESAEPTALRLTEAVVAVDVALTGDPAGAIARLATLRALAPAKDTVGTASPARLLGRRGDVPAPLSVTTRRLRRLPDAVALLVAVLGLPAGVGLGVRHDPHGGPALIGIGIAPEAARVAAVADRAMRRLELSPHAIATAISRGEPSP